MKQSRRTNRGRGRERKTREKKTKMGRKRVKTKEFPPTGKQSKEERETEREKKQVLGFFCGVRRVEETREKLASKKEVLSSQSHVPFQVYVHLNLMITMARPAPFLLAV